MQNSDAAAQIEGRYALCPAAEFADRATREFRIGGGDWPLRVFVVRDGDAFHAYANVCPHLGRPLNWQPDRFLTKDGAAIICTSHGALFEKATGLCIAGPCLGNSLTRYPLERDANGMVVLIVSGRADRSV